MTHRPTRNSGITRNESCLSLHKNLAYHVSVRPDKVAMVYEQQAKTFRQLYEMACRIALAIADQGIGPGDHVGIYLRNHWSYIPIYYALSMSGVVAVPMNYMLRSEQLGALLELTECKFLFTEMSQYHEVEKLSRSPSRVIPLCFVDDGVRGDSHRVVDWLVPDRPCKEPAVNVAINDPMMILFSSGTTDLPKGIVLSHLNRVLYFFELGMEYGIRYNEVNLCTTPLYHNAAIFFAFNNLYFGSTTVVHRKFDVERTFQDIQRHRVTNAFFVPTQLEQLIQSDVSANYDLSSLRVIVSGAAPLATATKEAILECFSGIELHELYGLTETGLITNLRPEDQLRKVRCAGQAFLNMQFRIVDEEGTGLQTGNVGEIVTRGTTLFDGYFGNDEATSAAWKNGWFHTGDLGKTDDEGFLYIVDRLKDMIISGGVNIYPKDVEDVIDALEQVTDVAVIGIPDKKWGEVIHAIVVCREGAVLTEDGVISACRTKLAGFQIPRSVEFRSELPRNPSGKLLKRVLRAEFL
jgi:acyl-CoA synthetase (AMP-forming)/AMP-acid ligase II